MWSLERGRLTDAVRDIKPNREVVEAVLDEVTDGVVELLQRNARSTGLALNFGTDMPDLPGRPGCLQSGHDRRGDRPEPSLVEPHRTATPIQGSRDEGVGIDAVLPGFLAPLRPLVGLRARLVLALARLQVGLLGKRLRLDRCRWAAVLGLEPCGEPGLLHVDCVSALRPHRQQGPVDALNLPDRALAGIGASVDEPHAELLDQLGLDPGVVPLARGDLRLEQHPSVQGQPLASVLGGRLDLVRHGDVGMQVRVAGA